MKKLNNIKFQRGNGGLGRTAQSQDHISGLIFKLPGEPVFSEEALTNVPEFEVMKMDAEIKGNIAHYMKFYISEADKFSEQVKEGVNLDAEDVRMHHAAMFLYYHIFEFTRLNPEGEIYIGVDYSQTGNISDVHVKEMQKVAQGAIRQIGIVDSNLQGFNNLRYSAFDLRYELQTPASLVFTYPACEVTITTEDTGNTDSEGNPLYKHTYSTLQLKGLSALTGEDHTEYGMGEGLSLLIGTEMDENVVKLLGQHAYCGCIGACIGAISKAAVNESISWVEKFPMGLKQPGFITGDKLNQVSPLLLDSLNDKRYLFLRTFTGYAGNFFNDSFTLAEEESDYLYIENVRTMDKACRETYKKMVPHIGRPVPIDPETGKIEPTTVAFLEEEAGKALKAMEAAGELSGYRATIDADQSVLATSELTIVIENVPTATLRNINIPISYTQKLN